MKKNKKSKIPESLTIGLSDKALENILIMYGKIEEKKEPKKEYFEKTKRKIFKKSQKH